MKYRTCIKDIRNSANPLYIPYGGAQFLLKPFEPCAYTAGVYGWNFDVYEFPQATICTGYRGMPGRRAKNYAEYDKRAEKIYTDPSLTYEQQKELIKSLFQEFIAQA